MLPSYRHLDAFFGKIAAKDILPLIGEELDNTSSPAEAAETVARFGRFLLGGLWETYVEKAGV